MLEKKDLLQLAKIAANETPSNSAAVAYSYEGENFTYEKVNETLRKELNELAGNNAAYRRNKNLIFEIIEETVSEVLPKKLVEAYDQFAEIKTFNQGEKPQFRRKLSGRNRAKQFITRVGLAGKYEVFKLGPKEDEVFEVATSALGGAAQIGMEEFLDGRVDFAELINIVVEGMNDVIYEEIAASLQGAIKQLPKANVVAAAGFDEAAFDTLLTVASAYGDPVIYCTHEFAVRMVPQEAWRYTEAMKDQLYRTGRLADYKGHRVVILPQGFKDETNSEKVVNPGYCWIIPTGADTRPVKVAIEGETLVREVEREDWSREIQTYKKVGVNTMMTNNICSYTDTSLVNQMTTWSLKDTVKNVVYTKALV